MSASTMKAQNTPLRPDEQPLSQYRSISPLALAALGLGMASALVLVSLLLAPLPVAAIVAAVCALRAIHASEGQLVGRPFALAGLALATFFIGFGLTRHVMRQSLIERRAEEMADVWLGLIADGKLQQAHQFRQSAALRITAPEAIAEHYRTNREAAKELQSFVSSDGVKQLIARGSQADVRFDTVTSALRDGQTDILVLKYTYAPAGKPAGERQPLWIHINRRYEEATKRPEWEVGSVDTTPPAGSE